MTVALVTGSSRGIGRAVVDQLAAAGHDCVVHCRRRRDLADQVALDLHGRGVRAKVCIADLESHEELDRMVDNVEREFGRLDVLVANAASTSFRPLSTALPHHVERTFATVLGSFIHLVRRSVPLMKGGQGRIVAIGGLDARFAQSGHGVLGAAKAGLEAVARSLAVELGPAAITANVVVPGVIDTESLETYLRGNQSVLRDIIDQTPVGRLGTPSDIAAVVAFLCSPKAAFITGQTLVVDGGVSAHGGPWGSFRELWSDG